MSFNRAWLGRIIWPEQPVRVQPVHEVLQVPGQPPEPPLHLPQGPDQDQENLEDSGWQSRSEENQFGSNS